MGGSLFNFAVTTIFAREVLEGSIIIGEYRTIILRGDSLVQGIPTQDALREINRSALAATAVALLMIAVIATTLILLSRDFDTTTSNIIEGISKIVAAISLLQLSLKLPKWLGIYGSRKQKNLDRSQTSGGSLTLQSIRFNVAWNIWREVAECGVFLIPFFLNEDDLDEIPLSAVIGIVVGLALGVGLYEANKRLTEKLALTIFAVSLLVVLAAGLFTGGCHKLEMELGETNLVWSLNGKFWSVNRLPMTVFKPFGYNDSRTVLEIICYWSWLSLAMILHYRKYSISPKPAGPDSIPEKSVYPEQSENVFKVKIGEDGATDDVGDGSTDSGPTSNEKSNNNNNNSIPSETA